MPIKDIEKRRAYEKAYREANSEKISTRKKSHYERNKEKVLEKNKTWRKTNPDKMKNYRRLASVKDKKNSYDRIYKANKKKSNPSYKLSLLLRERVRSSLKGISKSKRTLELLGCSLEELKIHLESQFKEGMTWDNHGTHGWHIDHIKPCASFDLSDPEEQKKCFHYTNLQPLWWHENLSKGSKLS